MGIFLLDYWVRATKQIHPRRLCFQHKIKASYFLPVWDIYGSPCWIREKSAFFKNLLNSKLKWWRQRPHRFRTVYWYPVRVFLLNHSILEKSKISWKRLQTSSRCLAKMCSRYPRDVFKTHHQVKMSLLTHLQGVFETYWTRFLDILQRRLSTERFAEVTIPRNSWPGYKISKSELFGCTVF